MVRFMSLDNLYISQGSISLSPLSRGLHLRKTPPNLHHWHAFHHLKISSKQNTIRHGHGAGCQMSAVYVFCSCCCGVCRCSNLQLHCPREGQCSTALVEGDRSSLQHYCTALRSTVLGCTVQYHNNSTHSTIFFQIHITLYFAMFRPSFKFTDFLSLSFLEAILWETMSEMEAASVLAKSTIANDNNDTAIIWHCPRRNRQV